MQKRLSLFESKQPYNRKLFWNLPTENMVAWWRFDQINGSDVTDSSGNDLNGKLMGMACIIEDNERGYVLSLDGIGSYVDCGNDSAFDITGPITVAAWVRIRAFDKEWQGIITKGNSAWGLHRDSFGEVLKFSCYGIQGLSRLDDSVQGKVSINDEKWHHIVATYNRTKLSLYVDSILDSSNIARGEINVNDSAVWIGGNSMRVGENNSDWNGLIDDVRVYNRALGSEEIFELYNETKSRGITDLKYQPHLIYSDSTSVPF